ncbi:threonine/serine exporter family protein [Mycolicibacterium sp. S2-37]|uniref:threonine/serine ThrE exporter family protein n=1 Tax=Mycolicibacterium sp. S2-37 TaxID=2810297 RepID=UPI001A9528F0|nr:threonine/serine exporter family protein [Mycolicibacterium sp. S2-37]MBO0676306.1 threonine/serine exporter family protein [Mycolicibacterium sp. S2-37]
MTGDHDPAALHFVAGLGAAMASANYPVTMVRNTMVTASGAYGLDNQYLALPNYVQVGNSETGALSIAHPDRDLRFDQTFALSTLIGKAQRGAIDPVDGSAELERIWAMPMRFPTWVGVIGYALQSAGLALILQPAPLTLLLAVVFGTVVGVLSELGRRSDALAQLLPTICAFLVSLAAFTAVDHLHLGDASLRALAPPLAAFLPGAAITLAVIELSSRQMVSGASRLVSGFMRIAQLAFGILIAAQVAGISDDHLITTPVNRIGPWAPWLGLVVYAVGGMLFFGPPNRFLPWMLLMLGTAYIGQVVGGAVLGSYASGFVGGLVLTLTAFAISHRPGTPATVSLILPGFWMLVPGSLGLMGVTELMGTDSTAVFAATLISMISIALGVQFGLLLWRLARQFGDSDDPRLFRD